MATTIKRKMPRDVAGLSTGEKTAARTGLGLGDIATQAASAVAITGGSITGITDLAIADGGTGAGTVADVLAGFGLTRTVVTVDSIAALKALTITPLFSDVEVLGYYAANDGGGGLFRYNSGSSATDNGGTVIQPTSGSGRWLRVIAGDLTPYHFGAKGDGVTDDTTAVSSAIIAASGKGLFFPYGTFLIDSISVTTGSVTLWGEKRATIKQRTNTNYIIFLISGTNVKIRGLKFDGNGSAFTATNLGMVSYNDGASGGEVTDCAFTASGADAMVFNNCGGFTASFNVITDVSRGVTGNTQGVTAFTDALVGFNKMTAFRAAGANGVGIRLAATDAARQNRTQIIGNHIDGTGIAQCCDLYRGAYDAVVSGNYFLFADWGLSLGRGINCVVAGNTCRGNKDYALELADGCLQCAVTGNTIDGKNAAGTATLLVGIAVQGGVASGFTDSFDCTVSGNQIKNGPTNSIGVYCYYADRISICGNTIDAMHKGVVLQETSTITISATSITNPIYTYVEVINSAKSSGALSITGNTLVGGACTYGLILTCTGAFTISNTFIDGNVCAMTCTSGGLAINDLTKVLNTRIGDNHSSDPTDTSKTINLAIWATTSDYTVNDAVEWVHCNATGGAINVTLLDSTTRARKQWGVIKTDGSGNPVLIKTPGGSTIATLSSQDKYAQVRSYGTGFIVVANN